MGHGDEGAIHYRLPGFKKSLEEEKKKNKNIFFKKKCVCGGIYFSVNNAVRRRKHNPDQPTAHKTGHVTSLSGRVLRGAYKDFWCAVCWSGEGGRKTHSSLCCRSVKKNSVLCYNTLHCCPPPPFVTPLGEALAYGKNIAAFPPPVFLLGTVLLLTLFSLSSLSLSLAAERQDSKEKKKKKKSAY